MNAGEVEIYEAVRQVQGSPAIIRHTCIICKEYLRDWDVHGGYAVCWRCRSVYFPAPKVEEEKPELKRAILVQLRGGKYAIFLD